MEQETGGVANPYAAPRGDHAEVEAARAVLGAPGYQDQTTILRVLHGSLALQMLAYGINGAAGVALMATELELGTQDALVELTDKVATASRVVYLAGLIPFGAFLVRANKNARAFLQADTDTPLAVSAFSPASMVWWFAVPILSLVRPYQAVHSVWESSAPLTGDVAPTREGVLRLWWGAWLVDTLTNRIGAIVLKGDTDWVMQNGWVVISGVLGITSCLGALGMLRALHRRQQERAAELWS